MAEISIIVPAYNVENYIDICIESILASTFKDFELICVNDGSTDKTPQILDKYSKLDNRIIVINQENKGIADSRNAGKAIAKGKYISFVDSDDFVSPVMLARQYRNITYYNSDMVFSGIYNYSETTCNIQEIQTFDYKRFLDSLGQYYFHESQLSPIFLFKFLPMVYSKLYKAEFLKNVEFTNGLMFEDSTFFIYCYLNANKISYDIKPLYYYRTHRPKSFITDGKRFIELFEALKIQENTIKEAGKWEKYKNHFLLYKFEMLILRTSQSSEFEKERMFNKLKTEIENINFENYDKEFISKSNIYQKIQYIKTLDYSAFEAELNRK